MAKKLQKKTREKNAREKTREKNEGKTLKNANLLQAALLLPIFTASRPSFRAPMGNNHVCLGEKMACNSVK
jgi:hypothetical protein